LVVRGLLEPPILHTSFFQERARQQQQLPIKKKAVPAVSHSDSSRLGQQKAAPSGWLPGDVDSQQVMDDDPLVSF